MTAAKKTPAKAAPAKRKHLEAPSPPGMAKKAADTEGNVRDISGDSSVVPGVDPRATGRPPAETGVVAAPPTPTVEHALTANDEPGAGSSTGEAVPAAGRRVLSEEAASGPTRKVHVAKAFILTDAKGGEHRYAVGPQTMPADHAEHWYTKVHLAKGN